MKSFRLSVFSLLCLSVATIQQTKALEFELFNLNAWGSSPFNDAPTAQEEKEYREFVRPALRRATLREIPNWYMNELVNGLAVNKANRLNALISLINERNFHVVTLQEIYFKADYDLIVNGLPNYRASDYNTCGRGPTEDITFIPLNCNGLLTLTLDTLNSESTYTAFTTISRVDDSTDDLSYLLNMLELVHDRGVLSTEFEFNGLRLQVLNTLLVPSDSEDIHKYSREQQTEEVLSQCNDEAQAQFIVGDLNSRGGYGFTGGLKKPWQVLEDAGFKDGQKHCVKKNRCEEVEDTFNTASNSYRDNQENSWVLDYVFYKKVDDVNVRMTQGTTSIITSDSENGSESLSVHEGILLTIDVIQKTI